MLLAAMLWGTIGIATQGIYTLDHTTSVFINLGRLLIAMPILLVASWRTLGRSMFAIPRYDFRIMVISGLSIGFSQAAYFAAIQYSGVTIATLLTLCLSPIIVAFLAVMLRLEKMTGKLLLALVLAVIGCVFLVGIQTDISEDVIFGAILAFLSALGYAGMIVCGRFLARDYHPLQITCVGFGTSTLLFIVMNLVVGIVPPGQVEGWLLLVYLGVVPTAIAYSLFLAGMKEVTATTASILSLLESVVAAALAWLLFGETLQLSGGVGVLFLLLSFFILSRGD